VTRAGHAVVDAAYFAPRDSASRDCCTTMLARSDVYAGIIGRTCGPIADSRSDVSDVEHEFDTATALNLPRLAFLVKCDSPEELGTMPSTWDDARLEAFRRRLPEAGITIARVASPDRLELLLYQALVELEADSRSGRQTYIHARPPRMHD
jgi:hypothetical protein